MVPAHSPSPSNAPDASVPSTAAVSSTAALTDALARLLKVDSRLQHLIHQWHALLDQQEPTSGEQVALLAVLLGTVLHRLHLPVITITASKVASRIAFAPTDPETLQTLGDLLILCHVEERTIGTAEGSERRGGW